MPKSTKKADKHAGYGGIPGVPTGKHKYVFGERSTTHERKALRRARKHGKHTN